MTIRVLCNYILTILGVREMLPSDILRSKPIIECNEPMVCLTSSIGLYLNGEVMYCRFSVAEKLKRVGKVLYSKGLGLYIYELYRSPEQQQARFQETCRFLQNTISDEKELEIVAHRCTAGVGGGHQTGGAVDLTLCDKFGNQLDMGSVYPDKCPEMVTSCRMPNTIKERRKLLCKVMRKEGFVNYPGEWWHFAYGDQLWAAYRYKRYAIYGGKSQIPKGTS